MVGYFWAIGLGDLPDPTPISIPRPVPEPPIPIPIPLAAFRLVLPPKSIPNQILIKREYDLS